MFRFSPKWALRLSKWFPFVKFRVKPSYSFHVGRQPAPLPIYVAGDQLAFIDPWELFGIDRTVRKDNGAVMLAMTSERLEALQMEFQLTKLQVSNLFERVDSDSKTPLFRPREPSALYRVFGVKQQGDQLAITIARHGEEPMVMAGVLIRYMFVPYKPPVAKKIAVKRPVLALSDCA